jgi:hypothetical protein
MSANKTEDLDTPIWGARAIALAAGVVDERGEPDLRRVYYLLEEKLLPANKVGRAYASTLRRLRAIASGEQLKT